MMEGELSRLAITNQVSELTPMCTLLEIADAHGIEYNRGDFERPTFAHYLIESIYKTTVPRIDDNNLKSGDMKFVARFVNKYVNWPQSKLMQAYGFLMGFANVVDPLSWVPESFEVGLQTPDNPRSLNACVLYRICVHARLHITFHTTIQQMAYAVRLLRMSVPSLYRRARVFLEKDARRIDLVNVLMMAQYEIKDPQEEVDVVAVDANIIPEAHCSHEMLGRLYAALNDVKTLREKMDPGTDNGAIALAALNYGIDISKSTNPLAEYKILKLAGRTDYRPVDAWMQHWYNINPGLFDLAVMFNPVFPVDYYSASVLHKMAKTEGFTTGEIRQAQAHELMQLAYVSETFYLGPMPNMKQNTTAIDLDDVDDIEYGQLLCYGSLAQPLQPVSVSELIALFQANQNFTNPFQDDSVFSNTAINKLKLLLQSPDGPCPTRSLSVETIQIRGQLLESIAIVEITLVNHDGPTRDLLFAYRISSADTKAAIVKAFTQLLHAGMYMRGWRGPPADYPITKTEVPPDMEPIVALNVTQALADFESKCRALGKIGSQISELPLVRYRDHQYQISKNKCDGLTLTDRIAIIKQGDTTSNISSCIRLSSNWICASAHKYLTALGQPIPFDIFTLRYIS